VLVLSQPETIIPERDEQKSISIPDNPDMEYFLSSADVRIVYFTVRSKNEHEQSIRLIV
jgi:hypothetical protein